MSMCGKIVVTDRQREMQRPLSIAHRQLDLYHSIFLYPHHTFCVVCLFVLAVKEIHIIVPRFNVKVNISRQIFFLESSFLFTIFLVILSHYLVHLLLLTRVFFLLCFLFLSFNVPLLRLKKFKVYTFICPISN